MPQTTRFAPSPTGLLHLGHAHAAARAWQAARATDGRFLLRLEDIDQGRCRPEYAAAIFDDLAWLGLNWDGPVLVQSEHFPAYAAALETLKERGLTYPCFCTRAAVAALAAPHGPEGAIYPGTCRSLTNDERADRIARGEIYAVRLDMEAALACIEHPLRFHEAGQGWLVADPAAFGDVVLARRDIPCSYHLCVTHDDAAQEVTLVTRGIDLLRATSVHRLLQALLGWPTPSYAHHPLLLGPDGKRLAKRDAAATLADLRAAGRSAAEIRALAGWLD